MPKTSQPCERPRLSLVVERCLPQLQALALNLDTYGNEADAQKLHEVINDLEKASASGLPLCASPMEFVVNGTFKVSRQQVANTLWHAFAAQISWFKVADRVAPRQFRFRSIDQTNPGIVDYPLNEGGMFRMITTGPKPKILDLRLDLVAHGLDVLASDYPRHFADLVNENADSITADILLQCCLFGDVLYE
jgi:hypothetical protein